MKAVVVAWKDHYDLEKTWVTLDEIPSNAALIFTLGWLVRQDDDEIVIARDLDSDMDKYGGVMIIHKPLVTKMWELGDLDLSTCDCKDADNKTGGIC